MEILVGQQFKSWDDRPSLWPWGRGRSFEDLEFRDCEFARCAVSITADPNRRTRVRNLRFVDCSLRSVAIYSVAAENVVVDGLKNERLLQIVGGVFKRCTLRGRIGSIMVCDTARGLGGPSHRLAMAKANAEFYADVDWALDISEGEFGDLDLRGVPGHLIRRDPLTQMLVRREVACAGKWRNLDLSGTHWAQALEWLAASDRESEVFVAGKRARNFRKLVDGLNRLRDAGITEAE